MTAASEEGDRAEVEGAVQAFFAAFASGEPAPDRWERLRDLFLPEAVVVRTGGLGVTVYDVDDFIAPRRALLEGGVLTDFREWVLLGRVDLFGDVAAWFGSYAKAGVHDGRPTVGRGMKSIQLVRTEAGWRISAAAWDDERPGVAWPDGAPDHPA